MDFFEMFAAAGLGSGVAFGLLRIWLDRRLAHDLNKKLESFKHSLAKEIEDYRAKTGITTSERHRVYKTISDMLDDASRGWSDVWISYTANLPVDQKDLLNIATALLAISNVLRHDALYLDSDVIDFIEKRIEPYRSICIETISSDEDALKKRADEFIGTFDGRRKEITEKMQETM